MKLLNTFFYALSIFSISIFSTIAVAESPAKTNSAHQYQFADTGLGKEYIDSVGVDAKGMIYVATHNGLFIKEKNARPLEHYDLQLEEGRNSGYVYSVAVDANQNETIYAGTSDGFLIGKKDAAGNYHFTCYDDMLSVRVDNDHDNEIYSVYVDGKGKVYIGAHGLFIMQVTHWLGQPDTYAFQKINLPTLSGDPAPKVTSLYVDTQGTIYAGTEKDGLFIGKKGNEYPSEGGIFTHISKESGLNDNTVVSVYVDNGVVYAGTSHGLFIGKVSDANGHYSFTDADTRSVLEGKWISSVYVNEGTIYVGIAEWNSNSNSGLIVGKKDAQGKYSFAPLDMTQLNSKFVNSVYVDKAGIIYAGTAAGLFADKSATAREGIINSEI